MLSPLYLGGSHMEMMKEMSIDIETYSDIDIKKWCVPICGVTRI